MAFAYQRVWEAFQRSQSTADGRHDTPHWRAHPGPYAACVVRVPSQALEPSLTELRRGLAAIPGVRLHPDHFLHIMVQELGFVVPSATRPDEIGTDRLEEFALSIVEPIAAMSALRVALGGVNSFEDAAFLEVRGGGPLSRLHERLFEIAALPTLPQFSYLPHCTVAHYDGSTPQAEACSYIARWRNDPLGEITIDEIEIVTLDPVEPYPELATYAVVPLGASSRRA